MQQEGRPHRHVEAPCDTDAIGGLGSLRQVRRDRDGSPQHREISGGSARTSGVERLEVPQHRGNCM